MPDDSQDKHERESRIGQLFLQVRDTKTDHIGDTGNANVVLMKTLRMWIRAGSEGREENLGEKELLLLSFVECQVLHQPLLMHTRIAFSFSNMSYSLKWEIDIVITEQYRIDWNTHLRSRITLTTHSWTLHNPASL